MDWNTFAKDVHQTAVDKGWWDKPVSFDDVICMCICELAEAVEEYRNGRPNLYHLCVASGDKRNPCDWDLGKPCPLATGELACEHRDPKPEGVAVELGECVLRLLDYLATTDVDIGEKISFTPVSDEFTETVLSFVYLLNEARLCHNTSRISPLYKGGEYGRNMALCDCIGAILEWARQNNVDMESILRKKHTYNKALPYRDGRNVL